MRSLQAAQSWLPIKEGLVPLQLKSLTIWDSAVIAGLMLDHVQSQFAGGPPASVFRSLQNARYPDMQHAFAIVEDEQAVGFFILKERLALPVWASDGAITIHNFSIGQQFQGNGYGRHGLILATQWCAENRPRANYMELAVNLRNAAAIRLYMSVGYVDSGRRIEGPLGELEVLTYPLYRVRTPQ
ncbi:GNAT family N-acetyltransferase [Pseudaminobacter sp. NGMCC 1.201702]|uniref:GNAT family N-acetyltransferase n=1 Tax=Pseudaminobacter sp. NGMCC 1.201702 TaxID=3391825 RepID=UPI0039F05883